MEWVVFFAVVIAVLSASQAFNKSQVPWTDVSMVPERFVVFDLETTGLDPKRYEIIEIGAIRVNRDADLHDTFQTLVKLNKRVPNRITEITGISNEMVQSDGLELFGARSEFRNFVGDLPLVAFNAEFELHATELSTSLRQFNDTET